MNDYYSLFREYLINQKSNSANTRESYHRLYGLPQEHEIAGPVRPYPRGARPRTPESVPWRCFV